MTSCSCSEWHACVLNLPSVRHCSSGKFGGSGGGSPNVVMATVPPTRGAVITREPRIRNRPARVEVVRMPVDIIGGVVGTMLALRRAHLERLTMTKSAGVLRPCWSANWPIHALQLGSAQMMSAARAAQWFRVKGRVRRAAQRLIAEDAQDGAGGAGAAPLPDRRRHVTSWAGLRACVDIYGNYRGSGEGEERESHRRRPVREGTGPRERLNGNRVAIERGCGILRSSSFGSFGGGCAFFGTGDLANDTSGPPAGDIGLTN